MKVPLSTFTKHYDKSIDGWHVIQIAASPSHLCILPTGRVYVTNSKKFHEPNNFFFAKIRTLDKNSEYSVEVMMKFPHKKVFEHAYLNLEPKSKMIDVIWQGNAVLI